MNTFSINCYDCLGNRVHIVSPCPKCDTGCVFASVDSSFSGLVEESCDGCGDPVAFFINVPQQKAWLLAEPVKMKKMGQKDESNNRLKNAVI
ncbi:MAG: hypothetical protein U1D67_09200 [Dehalococcoidia bacterium]|nr:hypothetical protein [Dehalococcoidia bacterium]MDZ4247280.1 hypothetical protein [Dehalococcoidia bacterium]